VVLDGLEEVGEPPSPAPPLLGEPLGDEPARAGAASINAAESATSKSAIGLRSTCVAHGDVRYDKHNPFSFLCLRG
jgi:hypothetical protein